MKEMKNDLEESVIYKKLIEPQKNTTTFRGFMDQNQVVVDESILDLDKRIQVAAQHTDLKLTEISARGIKAWFKRQIKKGIDWYMEPLVMKQTNYNRQLVPIAAHMLEVLNGEKDAVFMLRRTLQDTSVDGKVNLKMSEERILHYSLLQLGIDFEDCMDVRSLPKEALQKIEEIDVSAKTAILLKKTQQLPYQIEAYYQKYEEVGENIVYIKKGKMAEDI